MATTVGSSQTHRLEAASRITVTWSARRRSVSYVELAVIAAILLLVGYLLIVALWLRVDYFDSYESLLNARAIVHGDPYQYSVVRPIFYPVLLTPLLLVLERFNGAAFAEFVAAHVLAVLLFTLFLFLAYKVFRLHLSRLWALLGVLALSWNLLLISQAPLAKEDIPGVLFITAAFFFYLRAKQTGRVRHFLLAGVMIGAVMGTRYQLAPLPFAVILLFELFSRFPSKLPPPNFRPSLRNILRPPLGEGRVGAFLAFAIRALCLFAVPVALLLLLPVLVYPLIHRTPALAAPAQFRDDLISVFTSFQAQITRDPAAVNYRFLVESLSWPLVFCAVVGAIASVRWRQPGTLFHLLWFGTFFLAQTYFVAHKEARYLIAALPPLYFFVARGLQVIGTLARMVPRLQVSRDLPGGLMIGLLLLLPAANAVAAGARFTDPVYTTDTEAQVGRYATILAGPGRIFWFGPFYPFHPRDYVFDRDDPFTYVYDYYAFQAMFWTREWVFPLFGYRAVVTDPGAPPFVYSGVANVLREGDVVIVNPLPQGYATDSMPESVPPLVVEQVHKQAFTSGDTQGATSRSFTSPTMPGSIRIHQEPAGYVIDGAGIPDGQFEIYAPETQSLLLRSMALVTARGGSFTVAVPVASWPAGSPGQRIVLLYYDSAVPFSTPGR